MNSIDIFDPCPNCGSTLLDEKFMGEFASIGKRKNTNYFEILECSMCKTLITSHWKISTKGEYSRISRIPPKVHKLVVDQLFKNHYQQFIEIYNESATAEAYKLKNVCGPGYRKALEFLIKDYSINKYPDNIGDIKKSALSTCIKKYITDVQLKETAERAAWIGNDEVHYIKIWENKDINDLKEFIQSVVIYITNELKYNKMKEEMPNKIF